MYNVSCYIIEVDLDPHRTFCPEAGCETVCHVCSTSTSDAVTKPTPVDCPTVSIIIVNKATFKERLWIDNLLL